MARRRRGVLLLMSSRWAELDRLHVSSFAGRAMSIAIDCDIAPQSPWTYLGHERLRG